MTKKDYELLARALKCSKPEGEGIATDQWEIDVNMLANRLQENNPRFNRAKFLQACGYND